MRKLLGLSGRAADDAVVTTSATAAVRYPGNPPDINNAPTHNPRFTGRENDLARLREELRDYATGGAQLVALQGLGGVGKTQVALEYVHRFKTDYDVIWWLPCVAPTFVDASLADLGEELRRKLGLNVSATANAAEVIRQVMDVLGHGRLRWLLVYDNADQIEEIMPLLPPGGGHVLVTSTNRAWTENGARPIQIDVFTRDESVAHLHQRVPAMGKDEAEQIAAAVGDLPWAVATAGAWLAETNYTVADYLEELRRQPRRALSASTPAGTREPNPWPWEVSLTRLTEQSPAAARLLELCSVMAPEISLSIVYSAAMAQLLQPYDPALSEKMVIGRVVQEINRLALIKLDSSAEQIVVHLLLQDYVRGRMSPEQITAARRDVQGLLVAARPDRDADDSVTWDRYRLIWPHLEPSQAMTSADEAVRQLFIDRVRYIWLRSGLKQAGEIAVEVRQCWAAMEASEADPGAAQALRRQVLQMRFNLGNILRDQGQFAEAQDLNRTVLAEQMSLLGPDHPHTLMTAGSLAADLRASGHYGEALAMDENTYPAWTTVYGEDQERTLSRPTT